MTKNLLPLLYVVTLMSSGCVRYYYKPNAVNTPLLTEKNQLQAAVAGSSSNNDANANKGRSTLVDVQAAWSPLKHVGVIANYSHFSFRPETPDFIHGNQEARAHVLEAGAGGYYALGRHKVKMVTELYLGGGGGSIRSDVNMRFYRLFVQGSIGMRTPWADIAFSPRISRVRYTDFDDGGHDMYYLWQQELTTQDGDRIDKHTYYFFEPCFTLRAGYKYAKVQVQCALADKISDVRWNYSVAWFTAGLYLGIDDLWKAANKNRYR